MFIKHVNASGQLVQCGGPGLQAHCLDPQGLFVCFLAHDHLQTPDACEYHCWRWNPNRPVPGVGEIIQRINTEIPH